MSPTPPLPDSAHIVLAEDDASASAVLCAVLGRAGYRVTVAEDGPSVLRLLETGVVPDILLLDWMLPGMSGLEVCHRVRQRWDALALPILIVTARADAESVSAAFDAGASDYLTKPFLGAELRARVAAHLRTKRMVEERQRMEEHLREREKLSALGLLVSSVAHDLNNPLSGIAGYAQLLLRGEDEPERADDLQQILSEVDRCRRIVGNLLSFARRHPAERGAIDVAQVLRTTYELRERHLRTSNVSAHLQLPDALPPVSGDGHQLQQVFLNILLNAEHALSHTGGTLHVSAGPLPALRLEDDAARLRNGHTPPLAGWVAVEFFNDGPPIPAEALPFIFEPFFTTKPKDEGTGLGLAICQRIVREHGGEIEVESDADGTVFRVRLPAAPLAAECEVLRTG